MTGHMAVTFSHEVDRAECVRRLGPLGNPILNSIGHTFTMIVPAETQWEWANRYLILPGVVKVRYERPASVGAPN